MRIASSKARLFVIATIGLSGSAVMAADANHGAELAKRWCATCPLVDSGQPQARAHAPAVCDDRAQVRFHPGKGCFLPSRPASQDAEFSVEPKRGRRYRRLHRVASQIAAPSQLATIAMVSPESRQSLP